MIGDSREPGALSLGPLIRKIAPQISERVALPLEVLLNPEGVEPTLRSRIDRLEELLHWLKDPRSITLPPDTPVSGRSSGARLWLLTAVLSKNEAVAAFLRTLVAGILQETRSTTLFSETGLPRNHRFFSELANRLSRVLLPHPPDDEQLAELLQRLFPARADANWLDQLPRWLVDDLVALVFPRDEDPWRPVVSQMKDSLSVLAYSVATLGLSSDFRIRSAGADVHESPFLRLPEVAANVGRLARTDASDREERAARIELFEVTNDCRAAVERVRTHLEEYGVSVDLVFRLMLIEKQLSRLEAIAQQLVPDPKTPVTHTALAFLSELVREGIKDRSLRQILYTSSQLLSRKVIERVGESGDHYITSSRAEYHGMVASAAGGGLLTTGTAMLKVLIAGWKLAPFQEGLLASFNYAGSFLLMQLLGFTLATKQPSVTAASLAGSIKSFGGEYDLSPLVTQIARVTRSQLAAIVGNIGMVIPGCIVADFLVKLATGRHYLADVEAAYVFHSLHPFETGTVFYAALTGVILWLSSVIAGAVENWSAYRRLPEAIATNREFVGRLGKARAEKLAHAFAHNVSGIGGNVAIGFLLGMTPILGKFFGLPLDVRHVTLSTGQLALAACNLGPDKLLRHDVLWAAAGIVLVAVCNFGVSFGLALGVAMRARGVEGREALALLRAVLNALVRDPRPFFLPPWRDDEGLTSVRHG